MIKKIKNIFAFALFLFLFYSCSNISTTTSFYTEHPSFDITVCNNNARLINPDSLTFYDTLYYKLNGTSSFQTFTSSLEVDSSGRAEIYSVNPDVWELTLSAYEDSACTKELLRGYALADNRHQTASVSFMLSSAAVTTDGSFELSLKVSSSAVAKYKANVKSFIVGLYDVQTGDVLYPLLGSEDIYKLYTDSEGTECGGATSLGITYGNPANEIKSGSYMLQIYFYSDSAKTMQCGFYSDVLLIEPGRCTQKDVIIPDVINKAPAAPQNLKAYLDKSSCKDSYYTVVFEWDDVSTNEQYFELVLKEYVYRADMAEEFRDAWKHDAYIDYAVYTGVNLKKSGNYAGGSLFAGSTSCAIKLPTGRLFDAEIFAVNSVGKSTACERFASTDLSSGSLYELYGELSGFDSTTTIPYKRINLVQISYFLNGGTFLEAEATPLNKTTIVDYKIFDGNPINFITINSIVAAGNTQNYPILYYGTTDNPFDAWVDSQTLQARTQTGYSDAYVYASYSNSSTVYNINDENVFITYGLTESGSSAENGTSCKNGDVTKGRYVSISIKGTGNTIFNSYQLYINGVLQNSLVANNTVGSYTVFNFIASFVGNYNIQVSGTRADGTKFYSDLYTLEIRN